MLRKWYVGQECDYMLAYKLLYRFKCAQCAPNHNGKVALNQCAIVGECRSEIDGIFLRIGHVMRPLCVYCMPIESVIIALHICDWILDYSWGEHGMVILETNWSIEWDLLPSFVGWLVQGYWNLSDNGIALICQKNMKLMKSRQEEEEVRNLRRIFDTIHNCYCKRTTGDYRPLIVAIFEITFPAAAIRMSKFRHFPTSAELKCVCRRVLRTLNGYYVRAIMLWLRLGNE